MKTNVRQQDGQFGPSRVVVNSTRLTSFGPTRGKPKLRSIILFIHYLLAIPLAGAYPQQEPERGSTSKPRVDFQKEIQPLLADRCFQCHGPDEHANVSGLRLDVRKSVVGRLPDTDGFAIVPGKPDESELIARISATDETRMPPPKSQRSALTAAEIAAFRAWILQGAEYQLHWSFVPVPDRIPVPAVRNADWPVNDIDRFVLARLEQSDHQPAPAAQSWRWLRRVTLDLTGVPPTLKEIDDFLSDSTPGAKDRVVDRLLQSPRFGQQMAVSWLDAARYADSYGYQSDLLCNVWPYRDWVVEAFNTNMPYDQFLINQIAGDLRPDANESTRIATAFNRLHRQTNEGGSIDEEWRIEYAADRVKTLGMSVLGLTLECARCHDHKFDPTSSREYYQLTAFFNSIDEAGTYNDAEHIPTPTILLPRPQQRDAIEVAAKAVVDIHREIEASSRSLAVRFGAWQETHQPPTTLSPVAWIPIVGEPDSLPLSNRVDASKPAKSPEANEIVEEADGRAIRLTGDHALTVPALAIRPDQPFSISFLARFPDGFRDGMLWHQSTGTDTGFNGTEFKMVEGKLTLAIVRFWPGNALAIESQESIDPNRWVRITARYDGTASARGLSIFVDERSQSTILRDRLYKSPSSSESISFGERFRTRGAAGVEIRDIRCFVDQLSELELRSLSRDEPFTKVWNAAPSELQQAHFQLRDDPAMSELRRRRGEAIRQWFQQRDSVMELMVMEEMDRPRPTYLLPRGQYDAEKTSERSVERETPQVLPPMEAETPRNRLGLALWLTRRDHPLTARVEVNRIWQRFFGRGIVESSEDFGIQGTQPTHPELLDFLAADFMDHGWNLKRLCRQIVLSATYSQTSTVSDELRFWDPLNQQLARGPSKRLSAELIRDSVLSSAGLLDDRLGGPPVSPYQPAGLWTESNAFSPAYKLSEGRDLYRRSLYSVWKRTAPLPNMLALDAPGRETCVARRVLTNTPIQAIVLLNDPQFVEAARVMAQQVLNVENSSDRNRLTELFRRLASRNPSDAELAILIQALDQQRAQYSNDEAAAKELISVGNSAVAMPDGVLPSELAAWTVVAQLVANSDSAIWNR